MFIDHVELLTHHLGGLPEVIHIGVFNHVVDSRVVDHHFAWARGCFVRGVWIFISIFVVLVIVRGELQEFLFSLSAWDVILGLPILSDPSSCSLEVSGNI